MSHWKRCVAVVVAAGGIGLAAASLIAAEPAKAPEGAPQMQLPPGWTEADMQKCMIAGMVGEQHQKLAKHVGSWHGKSTLWAYPGAEPMNSECTAEVTPFMDGRFIKTEMKGDMPGMGPFNGFGLAGFDNVTQKYVGTWVDSASTSIMNGTGEMSADGKKLTWTYTYTCPITNKLAAMKEVETLTSDTSKTLEIHMTDPKSGKEYKMMVIEFTKK